ncbi:MAG TPA: hypothetical protein P5096_01595 [Patescibacteria group bacterium]|nr:hypothetical protein [Patescibacteria group bacterium]
MEPLGFFNSGDIIQNIKEMIHCPFCGFDYSEKHIKIMANVEKSHVVHLYCAECKNSIMASISYKNDGAGGAMPFTGEEVKNTDLGFGEIMSFIKRGPLTDNEVMDFYKGMKSFDGDFRKMFRSK